MNLPVIMNCKECGWYRSGTGGTTQWCGHARPGTWASAGHVPPADCPLRREAPAVFPTDNSGAAYEEAEAAGWVK